ncbi:hypothetical protein O181_100846 [Austropuccinia psidii MF-1]|uniref:Tet-like 2OG-Fe(II) oxygenase domain-containing protein n=1 Tax=Austropuccinia psidii MF-1 TaxID=1389203 RepID=A0A9Q3JFK1_9BASI|nr:hypothetical protein [Austropuccinia psidii MF-1]
MTLMSLSQNRREIQINKQLLGGIMKGTGFHSGSDSGKYEGAYSRKPGSTPHKIETDNIQLTKLQQYDKFVYLRISHFSKLEANENHSLMEAAKLPNFSKPEWAFANPKEEFKSLMNVIVTQDGFFNKPHQELNYLNACTYCIFYFVSKKYFHPLPTVFTPYVHGLHFLELKMEIDFSKKHGIMEILWKTSAIVNHTKKLLQKLSIMTK